MQSSETVTKRPSGTECTAESDRHPVCGPHNATARINAPAVFRTGRIVLVPALTDMHNSTRHKSS